MPQMISLREWDPTGTLGPAPGVRAKEELPMELINMFMGMAQQKQASNQARKQDSVYRDAIKAEMGKSGMNIDVQEGMGKDMLSLIQQEKIKTGLNPMSQYDPIAKRALNARELGDQQTYERSMDALRSLSGQGSPVASPAAVPQVEPQSATPAPALAPQASPAMAPKAINRQPMSPPVAQPQQDPMLKLYEQSGATDWRNEKTPQALMAADQIKAQQKGLEKKSETSMINDAGFNAMAGMMGELVAYKKGQFEEQGGGGLMKGLQGKMQTAVRNPDFPRTAAFPGQRVQTTLRSMPLITGSTRIIKSIYNALGESFPDIYDPSTYTAQKIAQSLSDFYKYKKAWDSAGIPKQQLDAVDENGEYIISDAELNGAFSAEQLKSMTQGIVLTPEEESYIEYITQQILSTPTAKPRDLIYGGGNKVGRFTVSEE